MEDDADFLAVCLPCNKHNVRTCLSFNKRLSSVSKDFNLYSDFSSSDGNSDT
jgi:3-deoxy-D-arabino-heptulosonate 7-phosphate (DAHP) synthase